MLPIGMKNLLEIPPKEKPRYGLPIILKIMYYIFKIIGRPYLSVIEQKELKDNLKYKILNYADNEYEAINAINTWNLKKFPFDDFWETSCMENSYSFIWCLYAIVWSIPQYDQKIPI